MPMLFGALALLLLVASVLTRVQILRRRGIWAMNFGTTDKTDFLIPPFAFFYFYLVFAAAFGWPEPRGRFFDIDAMSWLGVLLCTTGLAVMIASLVSFGTSFRVGIDTNAPDKLVTTGIFAYTRNPIYVAFGCVLIGEFLIQPSWVLLIYVVAGVFLFHRQVLHEEAFLREHYGADFEAYFRQVRRYL
jgi:protein-S-isoprenylcysteine O-methyltransferase Ste14